MKVCTKKYNVEKWEEKVMGQTVIKHYVNRIRYCYIYCYYVTSYCYIYVTNIYVTVTFRHSCLPVFTWRRVILHIFDPKQLLRVPCILWCHYLKCYWIISKKMLKNFKQYVYFFNCSLKNISAKGFLLSTSVWFHLAAFVTGIYIKY